MRVKKLLVLLLLILLPASLWAQDSGRTYIVKKGDTLWGISEKFLKDPYYWPSLWSNNPGIANPHLIFPGQEIAVYDGRLELVPQYPSEPPVSDQAVESQQEPPQTPPGPQESISIKTLGGAEGFVAVEQLDSSGVLVDTVDNRLLMAEGDTVFCDMKDLAGTQPGDGFNLVELGKEIIHPATGALLGFQVASAGALVITDVNASVATARITSSVQEIRRGNLLLPFQPAVKEISLKRSEKSIQGFVVAARAGKIGLGQYDVIYLDLGAEDGLEVGNLLYISRPRRPSKFIVGKTDVVLPDVLLGSALVLDTRSHTASALILKAVNAIYRGDVVQTATE